MMMRMFRIGLGLLVLSVAHAQLLGGRGQDGGGGQQGELPEVVQSSGLIPALEGKTSIAGQVFEGYWFANVTAEGYIVFDLKGRFGRFDCAIGISDEEGGGEGSYSVSVDGEVSATGKVRGGQKAVRLEIATSGAKSLRIAIKGWVTIAQPKFHVNLPIEVKNVSPSDSARLKRGATSFVWTPVEGAKGYAIEIVATKLDDAPSAGSPRVWSFTTGEEPTHRIDLSAFEPGEYRWSVIAFDEKAVMSPFSKSSRFVLTK